MAIDLSGIINENEFYTHHYLSAILETDLKDVFGKWEAQKKEEDIRPPYETLRPLARDYFRVKDQAARTRSEADKHQAEVEFMARLLAALGYDFQSAVRRLDDGEDFPIAGEIAKGNGAPELWMVHGFNSNGDDVDPLEIEISGCHFNGSGSAESDDDAAKRVSDCAFEEAISKRVFGLAEPPRWVILFNLDQMLLLDRSKWNQKRFLRFDLTEIFGRREPSTFKAMSALLHRESVCPEDGLCLLDNLDENSHKHAFAVSEDLKYALRESIELLGNEAVHYLQDKHKGVYDRNLADQLTIECLRYMYRLLFLFYIEARPELGYAPMNADPYRMGYSLESLRDLESSPLTTEESRNGFFIHESIQLLFDMVYNGYPPQGRHTEMSWEGRSDINTFKILPLDAHLFDPERTPLLNRVKFRNFVLQEVVKRMSLTRPGSRRMRRGRISYAQLGINQLGAVYEALLSYRGFFAETDLYEVKKAGEKFDPLNIGYFVKAEDLEKYTDEEKFDENGRLVEHPKGRFIYRLAGRDREKSASYYTPESLTRCLVKYALKELLKNKSADEILGLTVCEPAMGSAAFLNEAVNQLAEAYLQKKQKELGRDIPHDEYLTEKQRVKMFMADNNVFGVDLNPVAVELAEVSLWLNTIYEGGFVPWFGLQLVCGNSLVGARRQVFDSGLLKQDKRGDSLWLDEAPVRVPLGGKRPAKSVYHFLLPDKGMANYTDKVIKSLAGDEIKAINEWRKGFTKPFGTSDIQQLEKLSKKVDELWASHVKELQHIRRRTSDALTVFGQPAPKKGAGQTLTRFKDRVMNQELFSRNVRSSSAYRRLKLVMDYWCALWFWPIEKAEWLPTREEFLFEVSLLLEGDVYLSDPAVGEQLALFPDTRPKQMSLDMLEKQGTVCVDELCEKFERFRIVGELVERYRFLHWELEFADLFVERGGFDLVLGNPPWIKVEWSEGGVLGDTEPLFVLRKFSASKLNELREEALERFDLRGGYLAAFEDADGTQNFLNGYQNYPLLKGIQTNLYKCFLPQAWMIAKHMTGVTGFIHPEGVYDDHRGAFFRESVYLRLRYHFQFHNIFSLFSISNSRRFSINIYENNLWKTSFISISNLTTPRTIYDCFNHDGTGSVPGIKDDNNNWNRKGHTERIITISENELLLFATLYDAPDTPALHARFPALHSHQMINALEKFSNYPKLLSGFEGSHYSTEMWHETNSQKDGTIKRETCFPENTYHWILSGPHFFVGNSLFKTPRPKCTQSSHYDALDLTWLPENYIPRSNYVPNCDMVEYLRRTPKVPWGEKKPITDFYRVAFRHMLSPLGERTLIPALIQKEIGHIHTIVSLAFSSASHLLMFYGACISIVYDFYFKSTGSPLLNSSSLRKLPFINCPQLQIRSLLMGAVSIHYSELWSECWLDSFNSDKWVKNDSRLSNEHFKKLTSTWANNSPLRTDYSRRQALVEIDVLTSMHLDLTLDELKTIYRVYFPVLRQNESDTWYDQKGRIVFTCNKGLPGVGFSRPEWNDIKDMTSGTIERTITSDTLPGGPRERTIVYHAPFDRCDREADYDIAWGEFEKRK